MTDLAQQSTAALPAPTMATAAARPAAPSALDVPPMPAPVPFDHPAPVPFQGPAPVPFQHPAATPVQRPVPTEIPAPAPFAPPHAVPAPPIGGLDPLPLPDLALPDVPAKASPAILSSPMPGEYSLADSTPVAARRPRSSSRIVRSLLTTVGLLAGFGALGYVWGPGLYDRYGPDSDPIASQMASEPDAPLTIDPVLPAGAPRSAEFVIADVRGEPGVTYTVHADFMSPVAQVMIDRPGLPSLEVLTYADDAFVRSTGSDRWYRVARGSFPMGTTIDRARWVPTIDELIPPDIRSQMTIDDASVSDVGGITARHLRITIDPALLLGGAHQAVPPADLDLANATPAEIPPTPESAAAAPAGVAAVSPPPAAATTIDVWVDGTGMVRRVVGAPELGGSSIEVLSTSNEAWTPTYPTEAQVESLTAAGLVELGL